MNDKDYIKLNDSGRKVNEETSPRTPSQSHKNGERSPSGDR